jgi:hypothetical protein
MTFLVPEDGRCMFSRNIGTPLPVKVVSCDNPEDHNVNLTSAASVLRKLALQSRDDSLVRVLHSVFKQLLSYRWFLSRTWVRDND